MSTLSFDECLHLILTRLYLLHGETSVSLKRLIKEMKPEIQPVQTKQSIDFLYRGMYLVGEPEINPIKYRISSNGKVLLNNDAAYMLKEENNRILLKNSQKSLILTRRNTIWVIIGAIAAILGILLTIYFNYNNPPHN